MYIKKKMLMLKCHSNKISYYFVFVCIIGLISFILLFLSMKLHVNLYDEGIILSGADRVAAGQIIHRDFYCNYGPAQFYILAGLFKLFSSSILVERIWDTVIRAATVVLVYLIVRKLASFTRALCSSLVALVWLSSFGYQGYPVFPALLCSLVSYYFLLPFFDGNKKQSWVFLSGVAAGIVALFRYDIGLFVCLILSVVLAGYLLNSGSSDRGVTVARYAGFFWCGTIIVCLPVAAAYLRFDIGRHLLHDVVSFPATYYYATRSLPFPSPLEKDNILIYIPFIVWLLSLLCVAKAWKSEKNVTWSVLTLTLLSVAFYCKGLVRVSVTHMALSLIPSLVLFAIVFRKSYDSNRFTRVVSIFCACASLYVTGYMLNDKILNRYATLGWQTTSSLLRPYRSVNPITPRLDRLNCFSIDKNSLDAIQYIQKHTVSGERIYSGTGRHDKIFANNVIFYFLADRLPATKWHHFDPGLQNSKAIQSSMIEEFESVRPRYLVLDSRWDRKAEPNKSSVSSGVTLLDSYIAHTYRNVAIFGNVKVMQRI